MGSEGRFEQVDQHLATNLRRSREAEQLSQDELATRMTDRGFGFSQATIWKIEQGKRAVKISEVMALADALGLRFWTTLLADPDDADRWRTLEKTHFRARNAYHTLKDAAAEFLHAQDEVAVTVFEIRRAGGSEGELLGSWVQVPAEKAVLEARIERDTEEEHHEYVDSEIDKVLQALRDGGYQPLIDIDAIEVGPQRDDASS